MRLEVGGWIMVVGGGLPIVVEWWQQLLVVVDIPEPPYPLSLIPYPPCKQLLTVVVGGARCGVGQRWMGC